MVALLVLAAVALVLWVVFSVKDSSSLSLQIGRNAPEPEMPGLVGEVSATQMVQQVTTTSVLKAPRYTGRDEKGRTWELVASEATQTGGADDSLIELVSMTVVLLDPSRTLDVRLTAPMGTYANVSETVALTGGMEATITQKGETLWLKAPNAEGALALDDTRIKLTGGVVGRVETNK